MPDFNQYVQMGRMVRDPELRYTGAGTPVADFCIATMTQYGPESHQKDKVFMKWAMFGKRAERLVEYFRKGDPIFVKGRIRTNEWEGQNGKRSQNEGVCDEWQFVGDTQQKKSGQSAAYNAPAPVQAAPAPTPGIQAPAAPHQRPDDDIPF